MKNKEINYIINRGLGWNVREYDVTYIGVDIAITAWEVVDPDDNVICRSEFKCILENYIASHNPDWCNDLDAVYQLVRDLDQVEYDKFRWLYLPKVCDGARGTGREVFTATARQIAEAIIMLRHDYEG